MTTFFKTKMFTGKEKKTHSKVLTVTSSLSIIP